MVPVVELRGAIPFGVLRGLPVWLAAVIAAGGNIVPVPFILLFIRRILRYLRAKSNVLGRAAEKLETRAIGRSGSLLYRGEVFGLILLVAIPLPGTGAWTGALVAAVLKMRLRTAFPAIAAGVVAAAVAVGLITLGGTELFN
jgi:uncharacterized membrane protein